jgi:hypothetical protein
MTPRGRHAFFLVVVVAAAAAAVRASHETFGA